MPLSSLEARVCEAVASRRAEVCELLCALIGFDTRAPTAERPSGDEPALQALLAERLAARGAAVRVEEPDPALVRGHPTIPEGFSFAGRPQLVARFAGTGGGRTLMLNGHVDVVESGPAGAWASDPFTGAVRDGAVWGRGACDMKGGVAAMVVAAETLADMGVRLAGDLLVNTVTEEESTGAGGLVSAFTLAADAAIVPEPSGLEVWVACRGSLLFTVDLEGRAGHAGIPPRPFEEGGAVNAIAKLVPLLGGLEALEAEWGRRPPHPYLAAADCVPTLVSGGEWMVTYPSRCRLTCHVEYLPEQADARGGGSLVQAEIEARIAAVAAEDPWLREHPPRVEWLLGGVPPAAVSEDEPIVRTLLGAQADLARAARVGGMDNWHDGASLIVEAGMPAVCFGPGDIRRAHTADEHVPVDDLVACAQGIALAAMRFCGAPGSAGGV